MRARTNSKSYTVITSSLLLDQGVVIVPIWTFSFLTCKIRELVYINPEIIANSNILRLQDN